MHRLRLIDQKLNMKDVEETFFGAETFFGGKLISGETIFRGITCGDNFYGVTVLSGGGDTFVKY